MSKKKASGNTMTLKDFHGGSIPSDLPLPSAPGVIVRPSDRSNFDRTTSWGNPGSRLENRSRPHSSPMSRHLDDKTPFLAHTVHIGRNFDEDERKPLDGVMPPRRTISDESLRAPAVRTELKAECGANVTSGLVPVSQFQSARAMNSFAGRVNEASYAGANSQNLGGSGGRGFTGVSPNPWQARKELALGDTDANQSAWAAPNAVSKLAHASALEKVSSGRWQSKESIHYPKDVEVIGSSQPGSELLSKGYVGVTYNRMDVLGAREYVDAASVRDAERGLRMDEGSQGRRQELSDFDKVTGPKYSAAKGWNMKLDTPGKTGGSEFQPTVNAVPAERPKLKLLPRTKPLDSFESTNSDHTRLSTQMVTETSPAADEIYENKNTIKPGLAVSESVKQEEERPKLNLKPRSQPIEHLEVNTERDRNALFGGARPRELVLKERGVEDVAITNHDVSRNSEGVPKTERVQGHIVQSHSGKTENNHVDKRVGRRVERKDQRMDAEQVDMQKKNWRNENRRNNRDTDRQQEVERPPSPETWRKPSEELKPAPSEAAGSRPGKVASAVELAQAFSRPVSDPKKADRLSGQRNVMGSGQVPFSRLMGPTTRPQINGY